MNRKEMLELLELPDNAGEEEIKRRMDEKLAYFQRLSENAPNDFLRKLHSTNTQKIKHLQAQLFDTQKPSVQSTPFQTSSNTPVTSVNNYQSSAAIAYLIRHTENMPSKTYPLLMGKNIIGRKAVPGIPFIEVDNDAYVSRVHAVIEVVSAQPLVVALYDDATHNGGKESKNGTYVNGNVKRITQKVLLKNNDTIQIGMTKLTFKLPTDNVAKIVKEVEESDYMKTVVIDIF